MPDFVMAKYSTKVCTWSARLTQAVKIGSYNVRNITQPSKNRIEYAISQKRS
jgi:hypothetical protein